MKNDHLPKPHHQIGAGLALASMILGTFSPIAVSAPPVWWHEQGVIDQNAKEDNHAVVNLGQAKWMAQKAYQELAAASPAPLDFALTDLFPEKPAEPDAAWYQVQKKPLNLGQLKTLAQPFYDHLSDTAQPWLLQQMQDNGLTLGTTFFQDTTTGNYYPWNPETPISENYKPATLGQLKLVFALRFSELDYNTNDTDGNGIPDILEADLRDIQLTGSQRYLPTLTVTDAWEVIARDYLGQPLASQPVSFTLISGNSTLPGGGSTLSRNTAATGKVNINDFTPTGSVRIRATITTPLGTATAYLPASINGNSPNASVNLDSGDYMKADIYNPTPPNNNNNPSGPDAIVGSLREYLHVEGTRTDYGEDPIPFEYAPPLGYSDDFLDYYMAGDTSGLDNNEIIDGTYSGVGLPAGIKAWSIHPLNDVFQTFDYDHEDPTTLWVQDNVLWGDAFDLSNSPVPIPFADYQAAVWADRIDPSNPDYDTKCWEFFCSTKFGAEFVGITVNELNEQTIKVPEAVYQGSTPSAESWLDAKEFTVEYPFAFDYYHDSYYWGDSVMLKMLFTWNATHYHAQTYDEEHGWVDAPADGTLLLEYKASDRPSCKFRFLIKPEAHARDASTFTLVSTYNRIFEQYERGDDYDLSTYEELETVTIDLEPLAPDFGNRGLGFNINTDDVSGPKYRKIGLNGLPISDTKPQADPENDEEAEETYIDALSLDLQHSTTDIYIPIPASDLALSVRRNASPSTWSNYSGLLPGEKPDKPFGAAWSSNITSYVVINEQTAADGTLIAPLHHNARKEFGLSQGSPNTATVIDENGSAFSFLINYSAAGTRSYYPTPTALTQLPAYMATLTETGGNLVFKKKFGTTLSFGSGPVFSVSNNRVEGSKQHTQSSYHRLARVADRAGNALIYAYEIDSAGDNLIPNRIYCEGRPNLQIRIHQDAAGYIEHIQDANGNIINYAYRGEAISGDVGVSTVYVLDTVSRGTTVQATYGYDTAIEPDHKNPSHNPSSNEDLRATDSDFNRYDELTGHVNLASITDAYNNTTSFQYEFDLSRQPYIKQPIYNQDGFTGNFNEGNYPLSGIGRNVTTITLPGNRITNIVGNHLISSNIDGDLSNGGRTTTVTDPEGNSRVYQWADFSLTDIPADYLAYVDAESHFTKKVQLFGMASMTISYKEGTTPLGSETFAFNPNAGYAASSVTDFSSNNTSFTYTDAVSGLQSGMKHSDPNTQTNAHLDVKEYTYDTTTRIMTGITDELGRNTTYTLDEAAQVTTPGTLGRRTTESKYDENGTLLAQTKFYFNSNTFPTFLTKKVTLPVGPNTTNDPAWVTALTTLYTPDTNGRIAREVIDLDASGTETTGDLITQHSYDLNGNKLSTTDPKGQSTGFTYDAQNRLIQVHHPDGTYKTITYDHRSKKVLETDENGIHTGYYYDATGRLTQTIRDMNRNLTYNVSNNTFTGAEPDTDLITSVSYNDVNSPTTTTDARGYITRMIYDGLQRPTDVITPSAQLAPGIIPDATTGYLTHMDYDGPNSGSSVFNISGFKPTTVTDPRGYVTHATYDDLYRLTDQRQEFETGKFAYSATEYDALGNTTRVSTWRSPVDAANNFLTTEEKLTTFTTYDALNRPITVTKAEGTPLASTDTIEYTSTGFAHRTTQQTDPSTTRDTLTHYDPAGRPILTQGPLVDNPLNLIQVQERPETSTQYDANSNVISTTNPLGHTWQTLYDPRNRKTQEIHPPVTDAITGETIQPVITTAYDNVGNTISHTDARLFTTTTTYDDAYRATSTLSPPVFLFDQQEAQNILTSQSYDANGNILIATDANDHTTINTYDALNRLHTTKTNPDAIATEDAHPADIVVTNEYDAASNLTKVTDALDQITAFEYDGLGRKTKTIWDLGDATREKTEQTNYDAMLPTQQLNPNQANLTNPITTTLDYDARFRLSTITYPSRPTDNQNLSYDLADRKLNITHPNAPDTLRDTAYTYDHLDRTLTETSANTTHSYQYDLAGNSLLTTYGNTNRTLTSTYDYLNRLHTLTENNRTSTYKYDLSGNIVEKILPSGQVATKAYDALGRAAFITNETPTAAINSFQYEYDALGNVREVKETSPGGNLPTRTITNTYDNTNRLQVESIRTGTTTNETTYHYDAANNRTTKATGIAGVPSATTTYTYGNAVNGYNSNQLVSYTKPNGDEVTFSYDANGNRASKSLNNTTTQTYSYDLNNRLLTVADASSGSYSYQYDARTRRILRDESQANGANTRIIFSGGLSVQEHNQLATGNWQLTTPAVENIRASDYGGGIGGILYTLRNGTPSYNTYNSRGDVVSKTNDTGTITWEAAYEAFGTRTAENGDTQDRQKANTKDEDPTGLLNEGMRYRDLEAGVFITRDPLGFVDGPNVYTYVRQNPWTFFDPYGLNRQDTITEAIDQLPGPLQWIARKFGVEKSLRGGAAKMDQKEAKGQNPQLNAVEQAKAMAPAVVTDVAIIAKTKGLLYLGDKLIGEPDTGPGTPGNNPTPNDNTTPEGEDSARDIHERQKDVDKFSGEGYEETSHPEAAKRGHHTYENPETGDKIRYDKGKSGARGHEGKDHFHRNNPNATGKRDQYLDKNGDPVPRGSDASHLYQEPETTTEDSSDDSQ